MSDANILTIVNMILATYYLARVILNRSKICTIASDADKMQIFSFSVLFVLYIGLVWLRIVNDGWFTTTEIFFWKVFDLILLLQAIIYFDKVVECKKNKL